MEKEETKIAKTLAQQALADMTKERQAWQERHKLETEKIEPKEQEKETKVVKSTV